MVELGKNEKDECQYCGTRKNEEKKVRECPRCQSIIDIEPKYVNVINIPDANFDRGKFLVDRAIPLILEVGSNTGALFNNTEKEKGMVQLDVAFVRDYENKHPYITKGITFVLGDGQRLPFKDKSFNTVVLGEILEHVKDPIEILKEAKRCTKYKILISVPDEWNWDPILLPCNKSFSWIFHVRYYHEELLRRHIRMSGICEGQYVLYHIEGGGWTWYCAEINL